MSKVDLTEAAKKHPLILNPTATGSNVVTKEEYTELARFVFKQVVDILSKSYGPYGSMALINRMGMRFSTKDGWRILMHTYFKGNIYYDAIHHMIFDVCEQMNNAVGDGTTTVVLIANRIYECLVERMHEIEAMDLPPREIMNSFDRNVERIVEELKTVSRAFGPDDVRPIATIASNDNQNVIDCLCELYERDPSADIQILESNKPGVSVEKTDGLKIPLSLLDQIYINNKTERCCDLPKGTVYMVFDHKVGEAAMKSLILPAERSASVKKHRLVVIAPAYEESIISGFWIKKTADEFRATNSCTTILCGYKPSVIGVAGASDISILLDTTPIDDRLVNQFASQGSTIGGNIDSGRFVIRNAQAGVEVILGECESAKIGVESTSFFSGLHPSINMLEKQKELIRAEIKDLEENMTLTEKTTSMKLSQLRKRLARLELKVSVIYYGSESDFAKEALHDTIEDGVRALESARSTGVIRGSQYDLIDVCKNIIKKKLSKIDDIIMECIIRGIQNTLVYDLYGKSKAFRDAFRDEIDSEADDEYKLRAYACKDALENGLDRQLTIVDLMPHDKVYPLDLITMNQNQNLIASTETDICAIQSSIELLKILIAGNQLLMVEV